MSIEEIVNVREGLNEEIAALLSDFEKQTGVAISEVSFVRREQGTFSDKKIQYVVNCFCKI